MNDLEYNQLLIALHIFPSLREYGINTIEMVNQLKDDYGLYYTLENFIEYGKKNLNKKLEAHSITFDQLLFDAIQKPSDKIEEYF